MLKKEDSQHVSFFCVLLVLWKAAATRQPLVRNLNPRGPIWMRNEDFGLSECPFYIAHPPSPKHAHVHTHALISMHTRPVKDLRTAVGHGLAWHFGRDGEDGCAAVNMYVYTACMKSMPTHTKH